MFSEGGPFLVRYVRATVDDEARIQKFLSQFVDDNLSERIPDYLKVKSGGLYIAYEDENLLGVAVVLLPKPHEAYLGAMRIRPELQGKDLGEAFAAFQVEESHRLGAHVVRALVSRGNDATRHILQDKLGFHEVDEWVVGRIDHIDSVRDRDDMAGPAWAVDRERLTSFWNQHPEDLWASRDHYTPQGLSFEDMWHRVGMGTVAVSPQGGDGDVDSLAMFGIHDHVLHLHYLKSFGRHLKSLVSYLAAEAHAWGVKTMQFGLPRAAADKLAEVLDAPIDETWRGVVFEKHNGLSGSAVPTA